MDLQTVEALLRDGADLNEVREDGETPLELAASVRHNEVCSISRLVLP